METDLRELFPEAKGLDEKSVTALLKAVKENYKNGSFDYLNFKKSIASLLDMDMSEELAVRSAFATASTLGLTRENLLQSAKKYIIALEGERENFAEAVLGQKAHQIDGRKAEVKELGKKIEENKLRIMELEREIAIFQERIDNVDQDVEASRKKIDTAQGRFMKAFDAIHSGIKDDMERIKKYL